MLNRIMQNKAKITGGIAVGCWSALGFYRGIKEYKYRYAQPGHAHNRNNPHLISNTIDHGSKMLVAGLLGALIYIHPFYMPFTIPREIYRLEVCIKGLEDEKKTDRYKSYL